ncbi:MAG: HNH endonuclease, partial [Mycobacterium sp.]|nr:HNH endonuclease [Mycobacterium sp.]
ERGGPSKRTLADVLRVSPGQAARRIRNAGQLSPRTTLTGQQVPPALPATATAWHAGILDGEHVRVIDTFMRDLPDHIAPTDAADAEAFLAEHAAALRPDQLAKLAGQLALRLNPDGQFSDADRARKRGFSWCGGQGPDGMSTGRLTATPELRALLEAWMAKFAAPGMCNPEDQTPTITEEPTPQVADRDTRSHRQRQHDALAALIRGQLGDPKLGQHQGLPVTVIVSATLEQLHTAAGMAVTAGGTLLPMPDVIRMASHAWHYLAVFDRHTERALYLGRSRRIASADQRIVLHTKDRGCTFPGCDKPGYLSQAHHVDEWANGGLTNIDKLTFACKCHHSWLKSGGWTTRKLKDGSTQWLPPPRLPLRGGTNTYHHPERMLPRDDSDAA